MTTGTDREIRLRALARARWKVAISLTIMMVFVYFGFVTLIAFNKPLLGRMVTRGLSLGVLLGVVVIASTWILTWLYVRWANGHYDAELASMRDR